MHYTTGWSANQSTIDVLRVLKFLNDWTSMNPGQAPGAADVATDMGLPRESVSAAFASLRQRGLVQLAETLSPDATAAFLLPAGQEEAAAHREQRENNTARRSACRAALLTWMDRDDDNFGPGALDFLNDRRSWFYGEKFTEQDVERAAATLRESGMMQSIDASEADFLRVKITETGRNCLERFGGNVQAWEDYQRGGVQSGNTSINVHGSQGVTIASHSPGSRQKVTVTTDVGDQLSNLISAYEQALPALGLDASDHDQAVEQIEELRAIADGAAQDTGRLRGVLQRVETIALNGTGAALGSGVVMLAQSLAGNLPM